MAELIHCRLLAEINLRSQSEIIGCGVRFLSVFFSVLTQLGDRKSIQPSSGISGRRKPMGNWLTQVHLEKSHQNSGSSDGGTSHLTLVSSVKLAVNIIKPFSPAVSLTILVF